ncbi:MAG: iron-containing alcohol dehydrogenase [Dehalococcoidia bacterium]|nr:iron-containing alcohol dehydrogenase [Dehalococcoidia bacterium]
MTYWFNAPGLREMAPLGSTTGARGLSSTLFVPRLFIGVNAIPEHGGGIVNYIAPLCARKKAFIVTDESVRTLAERVSNSLKTRQFTTEIWDGAKPEVPIANVRECADAMIKFEPDLIVGVGGGSVMDLSKAAWIFYERPDITDLTKFTPATPLNLRKKALLLCVPTTSGTGSEVTSAAVLTDDVGGRKMPIASRELFPDFAAVDPTFTIGMPPKLTAGTGLDALAHAIDCVTSPTSNDFTDALALKAISLVFKYLPRAYRDPRDREARLKMHIAATMAGIAFGNAACTLTHSLGHALGKVFHIHHGVAVGIFIPYTQQFYSVVTDKYVDVCKTLDIKGRTNEQKLARLVGEVKDLLESIDLPLTLEGLGITREQLAANMKKLVIDSLEDPDTFGSPRWITEEQCEKLFWYTFEGKDVDF